MNLRNRKRLAASILGVGVSKVWVDPDYLEDVETAITRDDVRRLISEGVIKRHLTNNQSRGRARIQNAKRTKGLRSGPGSKEGKKRSVIKRKDMWMLRIRGLRRKLRVLKERRVITTSTYRSLYSMAKGGAFQTFADLDRYIRVRGLGRKTFG